MRVEARHHLGVYDYGQYHLLIGLTVWVSLVGVVTFGSVAGGVLPFVLRRLGFDPATCSAPFVATLVDVITSAKRKSPIADHATQRRPASR